MNTVYIVFEKWNIMHNGEVCSVLPNLEKAKEELVLLEASAKELGDYNVTYYYKEYPVAGAFEKGA